jgi:hypothetical protein
MEQSLHQLQSDLKINDSHDRLSGGYLAYIKSKYSINNKKDEGDINSIRDEWKVNYECSQFEHPSNADDHSRKLNLNHSNHSDHSKKHASLPVSQSQSHSHSQSDSVSESVSERKDDAEDAIEVVNAPNTYSDSMFDSPNLILFDNFVVDNSREGSVDYGQYVPSGVKQNKLKKQLDNIIREKSFIEKVRIYFSVKTNQITSYNIQNDDKYTIP